MTYPRTPLLTAVLLAALLAGCGQTGDGSSELASARTSLEKQDYAAALIHLKSSLQAAPGNAEARFLLGSTLLESGDAAGAAIELRKALEGGISADKVQPLLARAVLAQGDPRAVVQQFAALTLADAEASADVRATLGVAHAALGERDKALAMVQEALKEWPGHTAASLLQARITAADGDIPTALAQVDKVLEKEPKHLASLVFKGELQRYGQRDLPAALATFDKVLETQPRSVVAHAAGIAMLLEQKDTEGARARLAKMKAVQPNHPETQLFEAQFAFLDKDHKRTRELATQLLKYLPSDARLLQLAGVNELRLGALPAAENYLSQVVKARPGDPVPRQLLAQIHLRTGQPAKALEALKPMIESAKPDSTSLTLAGEALLQGGESARAERLFTQAASIDPQATTARTALALGQVARGNAAAGFSELEAVAAADSGTRANLALIAARMRAGDLPGALKAIDALEKKQPDRATAHVLRGSVLLQQRDSAGAAAAFEKALAVDPLYYPATAGLASIDFAAGKADAARKRFDDLLARDPRNHRALLGLAELKARGGASKDEVTAALNAAISAAPEEAAPRITLINHLLAARDFAAALTAAQAAAVAVPASLDLRNLLATAQLAAGEPRQAVATLTKLASERADRPELEVRLAEAHLAAGDLKTAELSLKKALQIRPDFLPARSGLAQVAIRDKRPEAAIEIARGLQKAQPKLPLGYLLEADAEFSRQRTDAGLAALRAAQQAAPSAETTIRLHSALVANGKAADAERVAAAWLRDHAKDVPFRYYLGDAAMARKDLTAAEAHYRSVLAVQPNNALALNNVAWILTQQKKPEALALAQRANELMPHQPALMDTLAGALAQAGQGAKAVELQKQAIARAPNDGGLRLALARIHIANGDKALARTELEALANQGDKLPQQAEVKALLATL